MDSAGRRNRNNCFKELEKDQDEGLTHHQVGKTNMLGFKTTTSHCCLLLVVDLVVVGFKRCLVSELVVQDRQFTLY